VIVILKILGGYTFCGHIVELQLHCESRSSS